jgi:hypothetical protein
MALGSTHPLHHVPIVLKSGSLNLLEPSGPVKACSGIILPFTMYYIQISVDCIFLICLYPSDRTMALDSTQRLTWMSTRVITWGKGGRNVGLAGYHLRAECLEVFGASIFWRPKSMFRPVQGLVYRFSMLHCVIPLLLNFLPVLRAYTSAKLFPSHVSLCTLLQMSRNDVPAGATALLLKNVFESVGEFWKYSRAPISTDSVSTV